MSDTNLSPLLAGAAQTPAQAATGTLAAGLEAPSTETALAQFNPDQIGSDLTFYDHFSKDPELQAAIVEEAKRQLSVLFQSTDQLVDYGMDTLEGVMAVTRKILKLNEDVRLPDGEDAQLRGIMIQLKSASKYDMTVPENVARYNELKAKVKSFFGKKKVKGYIDAFIADRKSLQEVTDSMRGSLTDRAEARRYSAIQTSVLSVENQKSLVLLDQKVAVLQKVRELARVERAKFPAVVGPDEPDYEFVSSIDTFIEILGDKIEGLASRWFTGIALSPMLRAQYKQEVRMYLKLRDSAKLGMEQIDIILAQYTQSIKLLDDAQAAKELDEFREDLTVKMFENMHQTTSMVAKMSTSSALSQVAIGKIAAEVTATMSDIQQAQTAALERQKQTMLAIEESTAIIADAQKTGGKVDTQRVAGLVNSGLQARTLEASL